VDNINKLKIFIIPVIVIFSDQVTKFIVKKYLVLGESIKVMGNTVCFTYIENEGMAFGIKIDNITIFTFLSLIVTIFIFYYLYKIREKRFIYRFPFSLVLGGAFGNLIDRIIFGRVVDFMDVDIPDISIPQLDLFFFHTNGFELERWPIFNLADTAITVGMVILLIIFFFDKEFLEAEKIVK